MNHNDHVALLRDGVPGPGGSWADFGSGTGAFTLALAELLGPTGLIYSVDRDQNSLRQQAGALAARFPTSRVQYLGADYSRPLDLPPLDGIVMANALHFQRDKAAIVSLLHGYLGPAGRLILVEYDTDRGNAWVPHPLSFATWQALATANGFATTRLLATRPSRFLGRIYSALAIKDGRPIQPGDGRPGHH
jgi:SAM-dependent methyltransferase